MQAGKSLALARAGEPPRKKKKRTSCCNARTGVWYRSARKGRRRRRSFSQCVEAIVVVLLLVVVEGITAKGAFEPSRLSRACISRRRGRGKALFSLFLYSVRLAAVRPSETHFNFLRFIRFPFCLDLIAQRPGKEKKKTQTHKLPFRYVCARARRSRLPVRLFPRVSLWLFLSLCEILIWI